MTPAAFIKCGIETLDMPVVNGQCGPSPQIEVELSWALVLSEHLPSRTQLIRFRNEIKNGLALTVPDRLSPQSQEAGKDREQRHNIDGRVSSASPTFSIGVLRYVIVECSAARLTDRITKEAQL